LHSLRIGELWSIDRELTEMIDEIMIVFFFSMRSREIRIKRKIEGASKQERNIRNKFE